MRTKQKLLEESEKRKLQEGNVKLERGRKKKKKKRYKSTYKTK